jgi:hypothetical protein
MLKVVRTRQPLLVEEAGSSCKRKKIKVKEMGKAEEEIEKMEANWTRILHACVTRAQLRWAGADMRDSLTGLC